VCAAGKAYKGSTMQSHTHTYTHLQKGKACEGSVSVDPSYGYKGAFQCMHTLTYVHTRMHTHTYTHIHLQEGKACEGSASANPYYGY
jgi:hypothetical protein